MSESTPRPTLTSTRFIADTNVAIDFINNPAWARARLVPGTTIFVPTVVLGELSFGVRNSKRIEQNLDLSFGNQNAHYELGVRRAFNLASVQIIRKGDKIPFDVQQGRTIIIDTSDPYTIMDRISTAKAELSEHVKAILSGTNVQEDSPIRMYLPKLSVRFS